MQNSRTFASTAVLISGSCEGKRRRKKEHEMRAQRCGGGDDSNPLVHATRQVSLLMRAHLQWLAPGGSVVWVLCQVFLRRAGACTKGMRVTRRLLKQMRERCSGRCEHARGGWLGGVRSPRASAARTQLSKFWASTDYAPPTRSSAPRAWAQQTSRPPAREGKGGSKVSTRMHNG